MKQYAQGSINDRIAVAANPMYPAYVIKGGIKNLMIDAGINFMGPLFLKSLHEILGDENNLHYLFLTHSHYDHLGSMPYLKRKIPHLSIGGSAIIAELLKKDTVLIKMGYLSDLMRGSFENIIGNEDVSIEPVEINPVLKDGDVIELGDLTCEVYAVPGHTRDSLAFFIPQYRALFPGEAAGIPIGLNGQVIHPEFLQSFDQYVNSIIKLLNLKPSIIGLGHGFVYTDDDAIQFLEESIRATHEYRRFIEHYLDKCRGNIDRASELILQKESENGNIYREQTAFAINLAAQVKEIYRLNKK